MAAPRGSDAERHRTDKEQATQTLEARRVVITPENHCRYADRGGKEDEKELHVSAQECNSSAGLDFREETAQVVGDTSSREPEREEGIEGPSPPAREIAEGDDLHAAAATVARARPKLPTCFQA